MLLLEICPGPDALPIDMFYAAAHNPGPLALSPLMFRTILAPSGAPDGSEIDWQVVFATPHEQLEAERGTCPLFLAKVPFRGLRLMVFRLRSDVRETMDSLVHSVEVQAREAEEQAANSEDHQRLLDSLDPPGETPMVVRTVVEEIATKVSSDFYQTAGADLSAAQAHSQAGAVEAATAVEVGRARYGELPVPDVGPETAQLGAPKLGAAPPGTW